MSCPIGQLKIHREEVHAKKGSIAKPGKRPGNGPEKKRMGEKVGKKQIKEVGSLGREEEKRKWARGRKENPLR